MDNFDIQTVLNGSIIRRGKTPLFHQIYERIREAILARRLKTGSQLPPTRVLAQELNVSRNTVINAFEQLIAEGYLVGKLGAGTFVTEKLPDDLLQARVEKIDLPRKKSVRSISKRGKLLTEIPVTFSPDSSKVRAFQTGFTATREFPADIWTRTVGRALRKMPRKNLDYLDYDKLQGYFPLREAIARYLGTSRGLICEPEQILMVAGSQQGLDLTARVLFDKGDDVWIEDPNYRGALGALLGAEANVIPVPLDREGINIEAGKRMSKLPRAVYVTPSHHFPLGVVMSLSRRLELLEWSSRNSVWIVEDDYDSEFRYDGKSIAALQGLDSDNRVIYIGTFSKVMFPALRLGYLVVPSDLLESFAKALLFTSVHTPMLEQIAMTDFINEGHFGRHIRKMRKIYAERQKILVEEIREKLGDFLEVREDEAGMHIIVWLKEGYDDSELSRRAAEKNINVSPLSFYCIKEKLPGGLILGYTGLEKNEIRRGVNGLLEVLKEIRT